MQCLGRAGVPRAGREPPCLWILGLALQGLDPTELFHPAKEHQAEPSGSGPAASLDLALHVLQELLDLLHGILLAGTRSIALAAQLQGSA